MKTFVVIGLGRFGTAVATELCTLGHEVLAIDDDVECVQRLAAKVTHAAAGDARDPAVLRGLGVGNFDCAIVSVGSDVGTSALIALNLKELGVAKVISKATSHVHQRVLEKIGVDQVIFPEHEMGLKLARGLSNSDVLNFIELSQDYSIMELKVPRPWQGRTIRELNVRVEHHVNVIAIRSVDRRLNVSPGGDYRLAEGESLVMLGREEDINALSEL